MTKFRFNERRPTTSVIATVAFNQAALTLALAVEFLRLRAEGLHAAVPESWARAARATDADPHVSCELAYSLFSSCAVCCLIADGVDLQISSNEARILVDVPNGYVQGGDMKTHFLTNVKPQLPEQVQAAFDKAVREDKMSYMTNQKCVPTRCQGLDT